MRGFFTEQDFAKSTGISSEELALYRRWNGMLVKWNAKINLVSPSTLDEFWHRHALDSYQLNTLIPDHTKSVLDVGSGAGFPGFAIAIAAKNTDRQTVLCETNGKKANFLRAVIREQELPAEVAQARIETLATPQTPFDIITARAFASLGTLLRYCDRFWGVNTIGIFPKGERWKDEVNDARVTHQFEIEVIESQTSDEGRILKITKLNKL